MLLNTYPTNMGTVYTAWKNRIGYSQSYYWPPLRAAWSSSRRTYGSVDCCWELRTFCYGTRTTRL